MFSEEIKKSLLKTHKNTNEATLDIYIKNASNLLRDVFGKDLNKEKNLNWIKETDKIEKYFDKMKRSISTRRNYYNALLEIGISMNHPVKPIKEIRDKYAQEYNDIEDGLKSKKQEENFCSAEIINEKIDEYEKLIKKGTFSVKIKQDEGRAAVFLNILQIWMILKLLRELNFRGEEIATLEFVKDYQPESKKNMVITDGWFISKNKYKTSKKYGELIIPLQGEILRDLKFYHEKVGDGLLFKTARGLPMSSNTLTKYLINWSNEFLPPVVLEDGSKRLRNCSVNMIVKIFQSDKYGEIKRKQLEESKNRGNDTTTMNKHYVSTKKPTGFY
tara:strand:+ start:276 stop:1268 length:993 start_codon:yes stop_codon:yes gene_type:complete